MRIRKRDCRALTNTQVWIINALLRLMEEKEYQKITIKELTEEAELARATFYLNFATKDDVLNSYIEELYQRFTAQTAELNEPDIYDLALAYFSFWQEHLAFIQLLQKHDLFVLLLDKYEAWLYEISETYHPDSIFGISFANETEYRYFQVSQSASLWNMLRYWVDGGAKESSEYMAGLFRTLNR